MYKLQCNRCEAVIPRDDCYTNGLYSFYDVSLDEYIDTGKKHVNEHYKFGYNNALCSACQPSFEKDYNKMTKRHDKLRQRITKEERELFKQFKFY